MRRLGIAAFAANLLTVCGGARAFADERVKAFVVVAGDADDRLRHHAAEIEQAIETVVELPSDPELRAVLRGEVLESTSLSAVVDARRALGLDEAADIPRLRQLARRCNARLALVVRDRGAGPELIVFRADAASYVSGHLALPAIAGVARQFVSARAGMIDAPLASTVTPPPTGGPRTAAPPREAPVPRDFWEESWPYWVAGGLLAATLAVFIWSATDGSSSAPPVLRFEPSGR